MCSRMLLVWMYDRCACIFQMKRACTTGVGHSIQVETSQSWVLLVTNTGPQQQCEYCVPAGMVWINVIESYIVLWKVVVFKIQVASGMPMNLLGTPVGGVGAGILACCVWGLRLLRPLFLQA